jgi:hypothetical protein
MHTADEAAELSEFGLKIASYKCFQKQFAKSCQGFVREEIYNFYKTKMSQEPNPVVAALVWDSFLFVSMQIKMIYFTPVLNFKGLRSFLALWHFFANKTLPSGDTCRPKHWKTKGGTLGWKRNHKSSQILARIGSKDQKFFADFKNIHINGTHFINELIN